MKHLLASIVEKGRKQSPVRRALAAFVCMAVIVTTTYTLILPAITVDLETATEMSGMNVETSAAVETAAPETAAPETAAPETAAPETAAPETSAPETSAPETAVITEETVPAETTDASAEETTVTDASAEEAAATEENTQAAVTEAEIITEKTTDAPEAGTETEAANTEVETDAEEETEAETEEKFASSPLRYDGPDYELTVSFDSTVRLPEGTTVKVREYYPSEAKYQGLFSLFMKKLKKLNIEETTTAVIYEVVFADKNGNEFMISDGLLDIAVQYKHNTASHKDETILTGLYNYKTTEEDKMAVLLGKNGDESRTVAVNNDIITSLNVKKIDTHTYSMLLGLFAGKVKEETESESEASEEVKTTGKTAIGTVIGDYLNVRQTPDIEGELAGVLENGMKINVLETTEDGWLRITYGEGDALIEGYVKAEYVFVEEIGEEEAEDLESETENETETAEETPELESELETEGDPVVFEALAGETSVHVEAPADAFPEGTTMQVTPVDQEEILETIRSTVEKDAVKVTTVTAVDITFYDADGTEIQPLKPIKVAFGSTAAAAEQTEEADAADETKATSVVHVNDAGEANVVDFTKDENNENIVIETQEFSVYAIVGTETIEDTFLTADGQTYKITVTYGPEAEIPAGSKLKVEEILPGTERYDSYNEQAVNELSPEAGSKGYSSPISNDADSYEAHIVSLPEETEVGFARYFDISIIYNGEEIEPKAAVEVKIEYAEPVELAAGEELQIVHFADDGIEVISPEINGNEIVFEQESFSVTATVTTNTSANSQYALLVQYEGKYYEVLFDGTLEEVTPSGNNSYTVSTAERWTWYRQGYSGSNYRIRVQTNTGYEYIDPAASSGISTTARNITRNASGNGYYISGSGAYLGVTTDAEGNPVLTGGISAQSNAAVFYFATLTSSVSGLTCNHIDIGVTGSARVSVPLAYGTYYYADGTEAMTVPVGAYVNATGVNTAVPVTEADLMSATISAYTENSSGQRVYDNSFIINQYTSSTGSGQTQDQVRVGGTFPVGSVILSQTAYRGDVEQYITTNNQIYYEVDVTKPVQLTLQDESGNILYQEDVSGNLVPLTVTVNVTLTSNFSYWDDENECPGISSYGRDRNGYGTVGSNAGMDFVLGTSDDTDADLAAIEIIKMVVDEDGQPIKLARDTVFSFDIYQNRDGDVTAPTAWSGAYAGTISHEGYADVVQGRKVTVGNSGMGLAYDYSVDQGLVYIQESTPPETIIDADGNELVYQSTHITTEYAWRNDDGELHDNINQDDTLTAIPDVVGDYHSTTYEGELHNTFLEFYVYNVYAPNTTEVSVTKAWRNIDGTTAAPAGASVVFELYADGTTTGKTITLDGTVDTNGETAAWVATFEDLPIQNDSGEDIVYTVKESTGFTGYTVSYGAGSDAASNGGTITNTEEPTTANAAKAWVNADGTTTAPDGASVIFTLYKNGNATEYTVTLDGTADAAPSQTTTPVGYESEAWKATFVNLPQYTYAADTTPVENNYTIAETGTYPGYTPSTADPVASGSTITNTQGSTENYVTKAWLNADGSTTPPTGATVEFTLYADGAATQHKVTLDGTADTRPTGTAGYESEPWTATFINLPKYKTGTTTEIAYSFVETSGYAGYTPSTTEQVGSGSTITNTQDDTSAHATKAWSNADGSTTPPEGASVVFTLYADGTATSYTVTLDGEAETAPEVTGGYESEPWTATFVKLPKYQTGTTNEIVYTIAETTAYPGYTASTTDPVASGETITNTQESTEANALKAWKNADGSTTPPEGATVEFTLYADGTATEYKVTLDGTADATVPTGTAGYESEAWKATFVNLPKYQAGTTTEIAYTIAESKTYPNYTASTTAPVASGETITNTEDVTKVTLIKNDSTDSSKYLAGAVFTLTKKNASGTYESYNYKTSEDGTETSSTVTSVGNASGVTMYNLVSGDYRLTETSAPDGYIILTSSIDFTVNATTGTVTLADGTPASVTNDDGVISITVPNTPGQALPNTGGSGTLPYTLGGLMLIIASALMYGFRMRRRERRLN